MKIFLILFLLTLTLGAQEALLDDLLSEYAESEALYNKTKKESSGFLMVYSREDLERMQVYKLKDILKTIRLYTLQVGHIGVETLVKAGAGMHSVPPIKLYIDDHEFAVAMGASPLMVYGNMDLYFINHIEVYQGGSSIAFGNEPGSMVVRLYTKDPKRENSMSTQVSVDSFGGGSLRGVDAFSVDDYDYLLYANVAKNSYETYSQNGYKLSRDGTQYQAYFKVAQVDNFDVQANIFSKSSDIFQGFGSAPTGGSYDQGQGFINANKYFDDNWKLSLSLTSEHFEFDNQDDVGIPLADGSLSNDLFIGVRTDIYKALIEKKIIHGESDLLLGVQFEQKRFDVHEYESNGNNHPIVIGPDRLDIYMAYAEELYNINKDNLIALSLKFDHYRDNFGKNSNEYAARIGYIAVVNQVWTAKLFAIKLYQYPNLLQSSFAPNYNPNPDLDSSSVGMLSGELIYAIDNDTVTFSYAHKQIDDAIVFSEAAMKYVNKDERVHYRRIYLREEHRFDYDNKLIVEFFHSYKDKYLSPGSGALIQLFNKIGSVDIYNELIYRDDYSAMGIDMDAGYNYSLGVIYPVNRDLTLKCKGENLFDTASEASLGTLNIPAIDRRVTVTMEYEF